MGGTDEAGGDVGGVLHIVPDLLERVNEGGVTKRQSAGAVSTLLPDVVNELESVTEVGGTNEAGDVVGGVLHIVPGALESAQESGVEKRDELTLGDDVELILDGVGVTDTLSGLEGLKGKRQGELEPVEELLAEDRNELTGAVDGLLGLDGLFPVEKRSDLVGQIETTLEAAPLLEGSLKEKRRDVHEFVETVVVDAVGQIETTVEALPLVDGSA